MKSVLPAVFFVLFSCTKSDHQLPLQIQMTAPVTLTNSTPDINLLPIADAAVRSHQYAATNFGNDSTFTVKSTNAKGFTRYAFLKFSFPNVGNISSAKLRIYGYNTENATSINTAVYGVNDDSWSETEITWNTVPTAISDTLLDSVDITDQAQYYELDVTAFIKEQAILDATASLVLKNPTAQNRRVDINSRTNAENPPQLIITTEPIAKKSPDHIIIVWEENKGFTQIIGSTNAPFINSLALKGTLFTNAYAIYHPSYPNYITWFSGSNQGRINNECISGAPFSVPNLYTALAEAGRSFVWYSEDLPNAGSEICANGHYREKHNPTTIFSNVPESANQPLSALNLTDTSTFKDLPNVCVITPNMINNMHDGTIQEGDDWLKTNFSTLIDWCMQNNSVFMVYYDEDNGEQDNRIPVLAVGQHIKAGHQEHDSVNHYSFTKLVLTANNADTSFHENIKNARPIQNLLD